MSDKFGDRMKMYEKKETERSFLPGIPVYARIDGRGFSKFTKGMNRPYDIGMVSCMQDVTRILVEKTNACIGYTQSDEISLIWLQEDPKSEIFFSGKIQKMTSVLASMASSYFMLALIENSMQPYVRLAPHFDCRVFQLPNKTEAANVLLWRVKDANKNAIFMAARSYYSHKELIGKNGIEMKEMLLQKGVDFCDYPYFFTDGSFYQRETIFKNLSEEELNRIPEGKRPEGPVARSFVNIINMPPFGEVRNRVGVIFDKEFPELIN